MNAGETIDPAPLEFRFLCVLASDGETYLIDTPAKYEWHAEQEPPAPGVWIGESKLIEVDGEQQAFCQWRLLLRLSDLGKVPLHRWKDYAAESYSMLEYVEQLRAVIAHTLAVRDLLQDMLITETSDRPPLREHPTLRQYYAVQAMRTICAGEGAKMVAARDGRYNGQNWRDVVAANAFEFADSMLAYEARETDAKQQVAEAMEDLRKSEVTS